MFVRRSLQTLVRPAFSARQASSEATLGYLRGLLRQVTQESDFRLQAVVRGLTEEQIASVEQFAANFESKTPLADAEALLLKQTGVPVEALQAIKIALQEQKKSLTLKPPVKVAITGAAGQIGYALLPRIASGDMLGKNQPVILHLLERTEALKGLQGVVMELNDCAFPLLRGVVATDDAHKAFEDIDYALLVGAKPRGPGMERKDLMMDNAKIFSEQGKVLNKVAKRSVRTLVVGNPANTNCLIAANNAPDIPASQFSAMTRLDHNRAISQVAEKTKVKNTDIERVIIWGNHSATQYPDLAHATIKGQSALSVVNDDKWVKENFVPTVQKRGAAIIAARGLSSAASAASSAVDHIHDLALGTYFGWTSMAVLSNGEYGVPKGIYSSFPVYTANNIYSVVGGLKIDAYAAEKINLSVKELLEERDMVKSLLK